MYQELTNASNRLKDLFMELGCAGIVLAQLKKNAKGTPTASDLRETGAIENDSDLLIFLHTDSEDSKPHTGMFTQEIFNKVRFGETGVKMLTNQLDYQRFICNEEEAPEPTTETEWG
jgi:replicative DNA helicase